MRLAEPGPRGLLSVALNQDCTCSIAAGFRGLSIFNLETGIKCLELDVGSARRVHTLSKRPEVLPFWSGGGNIAAATGPLPKQYRPHPLLNSPPLLQSGFHAVLYQPDSLLWRWGAAHCHPPAPGPVQHPHVLYHCNAVLPHLCPRPSTE